MYFINILQIDSRYGWRKIVGRTYQVNLCYGRPLWSIFFLARVARISYFANFYFSLMFSSYKLLVLLVKNSENSFFAYKWSLSFVENVLFGQ